MLGAEAAQSQPERRHAGAGNAVDREETLVSNWAYMVIAALAWNIKSWFAMMMQPKQERHDYIRMEFRRFLAAIILIPAMVTRRARTITIRLIGHNPNLDRLFSAWNTTERTRFG
ncbi:hypothetical protein [Actinopolymorpha pittospori]|uniref:Transposase DDE domain-containing protein n=1 Tax=Actinopolymorpha pittospori TaxID=648752 RepID=A0A927R9W2_9ACTN|nr:hypothetical protein [Actinopolymorpha pittospori]MBE1606934.1 hypothetical protein [Actinopolymorpha pittospori]